MKASKEDLPKVTVSQIKQFMLFTPPYLVVDFDKSQGSYLHDSLTQRSYLDFYTFFSPLFPLDSTTRNSTNRLF